MANLGIDVGTDVKLGADLAVLNGEAAYRQLVGEAYATFASGRKTVATAGTAEPLAASPFTTRKIVLQAELDNTGVIVVGGSGVVATLASRTGIALEAGDSIELPLTDATLVYLNSTVNGDGVTYLLYA